MTAPATAGSKLATTRAAVADTATAQSTPPLPHAPARNRRRAVFRLVLGGIVAATFLWMTLRHLDAAQIVTALAGASRGWMLAGFGFLALGYACRILRWQKMLAVERRPGFLACTVPYLGAVAANNLLPLRAGDALRAFAFSPWLGASRPLLLATLLVERLLDLTILLLALGLALLLLQPPEPLLRVGGGSLAALALLALLLLTVPRLWQPLLALPMALALRLRRPQSERLAQAAGNVLGALQRLGEGRQMRALALWSIPVWLCEGAVFWAGARAIGSLVAPQAAWLALPVGTLATLIPSTPGYLGTFDYFALSAFLALDNASAEAAAAVVLIHLLLWLPVTLAGTLCLAVWALAGGRGSEIVR